MSVIKMTDLDLAGKRVLVRADLVITSYSIHYTKLYETTCLKDGHVEISNSQSYHTKSCDGGQYLFFKCYQDVKRKDKMKMIFS